MERQAEKAQGRIALLNSPYILNEPFFQHMPPLSLLYLASYLENVGFEPRIFDLDSVVRHKSAYFFGFDSSKLLLQLSRFQPDLIGITCPYSARWPFTQRLTQMIRSRYKDAPIVIGGIHPTAFPEYSLSSSGADFVILGEDEFSAAALLMSIVTGERGPNIEGLAYKDNGTVVVNPKTRFIQELDELPFPAYHLLDMDKYKELCRDDRISQIRGMYFSLLTSRSCPNQCTYCNMFLAHGRKWRARSPENVLDEIEHILHHYQVNQFAIVDDNFLLSKKRATEILQGIIDRNLRIKFITPNGLSVRTLDDKLVRLLKEAGALEISIAIESGSDFIRNQVYNKKISSEQIYRVVESCRRHHLPVRTFFMIGAPGESDRTVRESIDMMRRIKVPAYINITTPYKGTRLYEYYLEKGEIRDEDIRSGTWVDPRLPIEKAKNYDQILGWRRKPQIYNIWHSWKDIVFSPTFLNLNALSRLSSGVLFSRKIDRHFCSQVLDRYMPI